jgi:CDP-glucose 4,6-dehydratase
MNKHFWDGKKVLITGHTGFKGSWLTLWLQSLGAKVSGLSLEAPTKPSLFETAKIEEGISSHIVDIRNFQTVLHVLATEKPDVIFHLAAQPLVRYSYINPIETYSTNVMGTVHLLEAIRMTNTVRVVVNITSDKCYENREWAWGYRENEPMGGYDPYSSSKGCAELVASAYRNSYFNPENFTKHGVALASVRAGNVIGGGDWASDRLIPDILRAIEAHQPVTIRNPHSIRPWQHVLEPLGGYILLAEKMWGDGVEFSEGWNFGPNDDDAKPVQWIVNKMTEQWGDGATWQKDNQEHPHEAHYLKLDCSKSKSRLNWHPRWSIEQALEKIIAWHLAYLADQNMREISLEQIRLYENS